MNLSDSLMVGRTFS